MGKNINSMHQLIITKEKNDYSLRIIWPSGKNNQFVEGFKTFQEVKDNIPRIMKDLKIEKWTFKI